MDFYRVGRVANLLGVSPRTVRRWVAQGRIRSVRLPTGERRVPAAEIDVMLAGAQRPAPATFPNSGKPP
jgi:putative resolvase